MNRKQKKKFSVWRFSAFVKIAFRKKKPSRNGTASEKSSGV